MNLRLYKNKPVNYWVDDFMNSIEPFWDTSLIKSDQTFLPACDFHETKDYYFFSFDIPGVKKEDIHVEFNDNTLHISGEKKNEYRETKVDGRQFHEKFYGKFQRSFTLPMKVKEDAIETHFKNGVLELLISKETAGKNRTISVTDGNKSGLFARLMKNKMVKE